MKLIIVSIILSLLIDSGFAQTIPTDSLFLGQPPPGSIPKVFNLPVIPGFFAAERIAISIDGKNIYYTELNSYYSNTKVRINYLRYDKNKWTGPFKLFEGYAAPALSITGDTMYIQNSQAYFSVRNDTGWGNPKRFLTAHYFQETNNNYYYVSPKPKMSIGGLDIGRRAIHTDDTIALSLGLPINTRGDEGDFYVAKDESYLIFSSRGPGRSPIGNIADLFISYKKSDNKWTNPKDLGPAINNTSANTWSPYVTDDNKYLFFYYYFKDNSKIYVHWVKIDNVIDSLKHTNFTPYLNASIPNQIDTVGNSFSLTFSDSTFVDDDGNRTLTYSSSLSNGNPLPSWLCFEPAKRTFSGSPSEAGLFNIKVTATDSGKAFVSCEFEISIIIK